ncbi:MAG TPA: hypothetical protein VGH88_18590 [Streptosporangiaceae bacterium]|jgi:hypothetical protein
MADEVKLIIQVPHGSSIDLYLKADPPATLADVRVLVEHLGAGDDGKLLPPEAGEVVLAVPSPEALRREPESVTSAVTSATAGPPLVILVDGAEELRDDELSTVLDAALQSDGIVILRILEGT